MKDIKDCNIYLKCLEFVYYIVFFIMIDFYRY